MPTNVLVTKCFFSGASRINVKLISRLEEDALYRTSGRPFSSIAVAGVVYEFNHYGHNFLILDARTGWYNAAFDDPGFLSVTGHVKLANQE